MKHLVRTVVLFAVLASLALLTGCNQATAKPDESDDTSASDVPDVQYAMRWWNVLSPEQMVAALYGDTATAAQATAAKKMYADLDYGTKKKVNDAAKEIYGEGGHDSVGEWWETLDCRLMRVAAGDGNTADSTSPYCRHYPGSGHAKILSDEALAHVNKVGQALLYRDDTGVYPPEYAQRWWNALNAEQMVAALYGDNATDEQATAAKKMYAALDYGTKKLVNAVAKEIGGAKMHDSVGAWWETLNCTKMRIAAGDGNTHDPMSAYCKHYPGSDFPPEKILSAEALAHVNKVGQALLGRDDPGTYPPTS